MRKLISMCRTGLHAVLVLVALISGGAATTASAQETPSLDELRALIETSLPGIQLTSVADTPIDGLYEAIVNGSIYYIDSSARFLLEGNLIELETRNNLTEARLGTLHMGLLTDLTDEQRLTFEPENPTGRSITVFTDISCGFCRRLHAEIDVLLDAGVAVHYLLFPRSGLGTAGHQALESVWCNDSPTDAMTTAKAGGRVPTANCTNPIEEHVALAQQVGLRGTPLIYTDSGERIPGYREARELVSMIESSVPYSEQ